MKKVLAALLLCLRLGNTFGQELSHEYLTLCQDFLKSRSHDLKWPEDKGIYIWSPAADSGLAYPAMDNNLDSSKQRLCYSTRTSGADTVRLSVKELKYIVRYIRAKHDKEWRNKLSAATGLLDGEPWLTKSLKSYSMISAPIFLQGNTICVIYREHYSLTGSGGGCYVYKKGSRGWSEICDLYSFIEN